MSNYENFQAELVRVGYTAMRSKVWADFLFDQSITPENLEMPSADIDADLLLLSNRHPVNPTALFYIAKIFVEQLVPTPDSIESWDQIIELFRGHTDLIIHRSKNDLSNIAHNETVQKRLEESPLWRSYSEWETMVACGDLFEVFVMSLSYMHRSRGIDTPLVSRYFKMIRRLKGVLDNSEISVKQGAPKLIVTVHSRFRGDMVVSLVKKLEESIYSVLANMLLTTQQVNAQRIVMLKKLKRGTSVMIAADGKKGNHNGLGQIFNRDVNISDGFAWVAWKAKCPVVWAYAALGEQGTGLKAYSHVLLEAPSPETDFETYTEQLVAAYFAAIEDAIIQHPFGFGLLYPKRIGDRRPARPL